MQIKSSTKQKVNNYFIETKISKIQYNFTAISCDDKVKFENLIASP